MAARYGVDADKMLHTLKETAFKGSVTTEQMMALLIVAEKYDLNPWLKEIYAFPSQGGGIVPIVGVDGWSRIINSNPQFDGMEYVDGPDDKGFPAWIECIIYRKDRAHPVRAREYMVEVNRGTAPWKSHPRRMLRHKATIQCARLAFGFVGIHDPDEAERIIEADRPVVDPRGDTSNVDGDEVAKHVAALTDILNADKDENSIADMLRDYVATYLNPFPEVWMLVNDKLASDGIISKANMRKYLSLNLTAGA
jgi:phage recombination protein Bet